MKGLFLFFIISTIIRCGSIPTKPSTFSKETFSNYAEAKFKYEMENTNITGGYLTVVRKNEILINRGFGVCNKPQSINCSPESSFKMGSVSKTFTALGILYLADIGKLKLSDFAHKYLPELKKLRKTKDYPDFTIEDMLSHHSGLPSDRFYDFFLNDSANKEEIYKVFRALPNDLNGDFIVREPRKIHAYSNLTYSLLGLIIERVDGRDFETFTQEVLFKDLNLEGTSFFDSFPFERVSLANAKNSTPKIRDISAGSISTSAQDMTKILPKFWSKTKPWTKGIFSKFRFLEPKNQDVTLDFGQSIGWGLFHLNDPSNKNRMIVGHLGDLPPFHGLFIFLPEEEVGIAIAVNNSNKGSYHLLELAWDLLQAIPEEMVKPSVLSLQESKEIKIENPRTKQIRKIEKGTGTYSAPFTIYKIQDDLPNLKVSFASNELQFIPESNGDWKPRFRLFNLFPLKVQELENLRGTFYEYEGNEFFVLKSFPEPASILALGEKVLPAPLPNAWKNRLGKYMIQKSQGWDMLESFELTEKDGFLFLKGTFAMLNKKIPYQILLKPISNFEAQVPGQGRSLGDIIRVISEGDQIVLKYLGYKLTKI